MELVKDMNPFGYEDRRPPFLSETTHSTSYGNSNFVKCKVEPAYYADVTPVMRMKWMMPAIIGAGF